MIIVSAILGTPTSVGTWERQTSVRRPDALAGTMTEARKRNLTRCRALLGLSHPERPYIADLDAFLTNQGVDPSLCLECGVGHMHNVFQVLSFHDPPAEFMAA